MDVNEAIERRRSIRRFADAEVTDDEVRRILEAARLAPSWKNRQPWRFVVVRSAQMKEAIAAALPEGNRAADSIRSASAVIVLVGVPAEGEIHDGKEYYLVDCGIAGEHLHLRATELGIGTVWVSLLDGATVCRVLDLPAGMECVAVFPLGRPLSEADERPRSGRRDFDDVVSLEGLERPFR
jgi:nitroreductase